MKKSQTIFLHLAFLLGFLTFQSCAQQQNSNELMQQSLMVNNTSNNGMKTYVEPNEKAFVAKVPQNWQVQSMITRPRPTVANPYMITYSTDESEMVFAGNPNRILFTEPSQTTQFLGLSEGSPNSTGMVLSYMQPKDYFLWQINNDPNSPYKNVKIIRTQNVPQEQKRAELNLQKNFGGFQQASTDVQRIYFKCQIQNKKYNGKLTIQTIRIFGSNPIWFVENIHGVLVKPTKNIEDPLYDDILASIEINPNWVQAVNQKSHRYNTQNYNNNRPNLNQYYTDARTGAFNSSTDYSDEWSKVILDQEDVMNSNGEVFRVDNTYDHYYQDQQGNIINSQYSIDNDPNLEEMKVIRNY